MGKNRKLHAAKVLARNDRARGQVSNVAVKALQKTSTNNQLKVLMASLDTGKLSVSKLRKVLEKNAHKKMREGVELLVKKGKTPTVDLLMVEYWKEPEFRLLAKRVGLDEEWFTELARTESKRWEQNNGREEN